MRVIAVSNDVAKRRKRQKEEEEYEKNKTNFGDSYLGNGYAGSSQIWHLGYGPTLHRKI